jgi:hypothetical protein
VAIPLRCGAQSLIGRCARANHHTSGPGHETSVHAGGERVGRVPGWRVDVRVDVAWMRGAAPGRGATREPADAAVDTRGNIFCATPPLPLVLLFFGASSYAAGS